MSYNKFFSLVFHSNAIQCETKCIRICDCLFNSCSTSSQLLVILMPEAITLCCVAKCCRLAYCFFIFLQAWNFRLTETLSQAFALLRAALFKDSVFFAHRLLSFSQAEALSRHLFTRPAASPLCRSNCKIMCRLLYVCIQCMCWNVLSPLNSTKMCGLLLPYFVLSSFYQLPAVTRLLASGCCVMV